MNGIVGIVFWECDDLGCFRLDSHSCSKDTGWCLTNWGHGWPRANCRRRGPHWHLPTAVPPWAADLRKRRCRQQLRTWPLHHREGDCRPGLGQDQEVGWQLHGFLYWTIGSDFLSLMTGVFVRMVRIVGWAPNWVLWPLEQLNLYLSKGFQLRLAGILCVQRLRRWHWLRPWMPHVGAPFCGLWKEEQDLLHSFSLWTFDRSRTFLCLYISLYTRLKWQRTCENYLQIAAAKSWRFSLPPTSIYVMKQKLGKTSKSEMPEVVTKDPKNSWFYIDKHHDIRLWYLNNE